ncbi:hypothetical protein JB92DRAFT_2840810 [Gautieria morchelliformis]|nr:hypothetical protein JB92DRAFT_2840810 [Gautieria morchelliformis]
MALNGRDARSTYMPCGFIGRHRSRSQTHVRSRMPFTGRHRKCGRSRTRMSPCRCVSRTGKKGRASQAEGVSAVEMEASEQWHCTDLDQAVAIVLA